MAEFQSLTTLIKRLEAATSRLEDLATPSVSNAVASNLSRNSIASQPTLTSTSNNAVSKSEVSPVLDAYDGITEGPLKNFLELSKIIGGPISEQSHSVEDIFIAQRDFIYIATQSTKPKTTETFVELIRPTQRALEKVCSYTENNRPSPFFNHLSTVSEGITAVCWVSADQKPAGFVGNMKDSSQYYANRVIKEFKEKESSHVDWANSFILLLTELQSYVKKYHTDGLIWNPKGADPETFIGRNLKLNSSSSSTGASTSSLPPPPPPPPPPPVFVDYDNISEKGPVDMSAVFAELNRGESITSNLKRVDNNQMTHKNPNLRDSSVVSEVGVKAHKKGPAAPPKPASLSLKKPSKKILEGNKWVIENFENDSNILIDNAAINHLVYIYGCKNSTIQITGKINAVTIDSCQKTGLLLDSAVSAVEIVNCKSVQVQIQGKTPTISVDKTDSGQLFLSNECIDIEIVTSKSSSINVNLPGIGENGDYAEKPIPEQLKSTIVDGKLISVPLEHSG